MISLASEIFPIGIGTFGVGAPPTENSATSLPETDFSSQLQGLLFAFSNGENYLETSYHYAAGQTLKFIAGFLKKIPREKIFITVKLHSPVSGPADVSSQLDQSLKLLELDYVDSLNCIPLAASKLPIEEVYHLMSAQITSGKTRFLSGSNLNLPRLLTLEKNHISLFSLEGLYNLECKINEDLGILDYCRTRNILFAAYQPLRRNRTALRNYPLLVNLAEKYSRTQNQIIINWLVKHMHLFILNRAVNKNHINENIFSLDFSMDLADYKQLDRFRSPEFDSIQVDWDNQGGIPINKLANQFP
jgi:diketogulonate reductase-like aldo/keto reductase